MEQAVIVNFKYGINELDLLYELEDKLEKVINEKELGEFDGDEVATDHSDGTLFMYGPSAENIFEAIKPILQKTSFMKGAEVLLRFGPPEDGIKQKKVIL